MKVSSERGNDTRVQTGFQLNFIVVCVVCRCRDSQFQDEDDFGAVLVHVVQRDDVGVQDLLQDAHLPLHLLPSHASPAGPALPLLDELGCVLEARALLFAPFDDGKLPAADIKEGGRCGPFLSVTD